MRTAIIAWRRILVPAIIAVLSVGFGPSLRAVDLTKTQQLQSVEDVPEGLSRSDWASIRAAYEAHRHAAVTVEGEQRARNPGQQWLTSFDGRGFLVHPDQDAWQWGLQLESYGFAGRVGRVVESGIAKTEKQRVSYSWDDNVEEWFINDQRGLEHGFTIRQRPDGGSSHNPLQFNLRVRGDLTPKVSAEGNALTFIDASGAEVVTYSALKVLDADGKSLRAHFETEKAGRASRIKLVIDEREARYPITIDPVAQRAYLKASNTDVRDSFGFAVAISGDTVVVGARSEDSNASGVNGNQSDNSLSAAGAAYVFVRNGTTWTQQAYLKASNPGSTDIFGVSVAISGDTIAVAAVQEASNATGVNGDQTNNSAANAGAVYVFVRNGTTWTQQAYLKASNTQTGDEFGASVAISGDTIVIGADGEDSNATGVNGDQSNNSFANAGAAYVFVRNGTTWSQQAYLKASNADVNDLFGQAVAISNDTIVVSTAFESSAAAGINGNGSDNSASGAGAAYVFVRNGTTWTQQAYLKASNPQPDGAFGESVAISGDTIVVGADGEGSNATGVNGDQTNKSAPNAGAAYVFVRNGTTWTQQAYLKASNTDAGDTFGAAVAISGDTVVVGAIAEASNAAGVNGNQGDNSTSRAGAAYVFQRNGTIWTQQAYLKASNPDVGDFFGIGVDVSGDTIVVGAFGESSNATGINGNQNDNSMPSAGAAYIFAAPVPTLNLSSRMQVLGGDRIGIGGLIVRGTTPKAVLLRGLGPSLSKAGLPAAALLSDPVLELRGSGGALIVSNDDWKQSPQRAQIEGTVFQPTDDREAVIVATLPPAAYTVQLKGANNTTGIGLIEIYDNNLASDSDLPNLSTRGFVQTGDNVMIGGFTLGGTNNATNIAVRALGPSLSSFGLTNVLADPTLELRNANGAILLSNDNWQSDAASAAQLMNRGLAPSDPKEAAIFAGLAPGQFTAIVAGKNGGTGNALVEIYNLGAP